MEVEAAEHPADVKRRDNTINHKIINNLVFNSDLPMF
jgi:hypothetical protein